MVLQADSKLCVLFTTFSLLNSHVARQVLLSTSGACSMPWPEYSDQWVVDTIMMPHTCHRLVHICKQSVQWFSKYFFHQPSQLELDKAFKERKFLPKPDRDLDRHQNLITCFFHHPGPLHKISLQSVLKYFSNIANKQTNQRCQKQNLLVGDNNASCKGTLFCFFKHHWAKTPLSTR